MNQSRQIFRVSQINTNTIEKLPTGTTIDTYQQIPLTQTARFNTVIPTSNLNIIRPVSTFKPESNLFQVEGILPRSSGVITTNNYTVNRPP